MKRTKRHVFLIIGLLLAACADQGHLPSELESLARPDQPTAYLISNNRPLSSGFANAVARNGDTLKFLHEDAGFAVVRTENPNAYHRFADTIVRDFRLQWLTDSHTLGIEPMTIGDPPDSGVADFLFDLQWGHTAVRATHAWNAGITGEGVRVAVLDTGIDTTHPDLSENVNMALSQSFVPGEDVQDDHGHGTHVAGIIAATQNGVGVIGVAPDAEIVAVKVLDSSGGGTIESIAEGILYAADIEADIINMSLRVIFPRSGLTFEDEQGNTVVMHAREVASILRIMDRVTTYAHQRGTTVIGGAGNEELNSNETRDLVITPADSPHVLAISATGPLGWGMDTTTDLDIPAFYTNYGLSTIAFAAPGGNIDFGLLESFLNDPNQETNPDAWCTVAAETAPCYFFDLVVSTVPGGDWAWDAGTSMAAPYASGIAALIISENGGPMHPTHVAAELRKRAEDLGKPGKDPFYGHGRVTSGY